MKYISQILAIVLLVAIVGLVAPGCATQTPQTVAGKSLMTTAQTVDSALQAFAVWVKTKEGTPTPVAQSTIDQVEIVRMKYAASIEIARQAWVAAATNPAQQSTLTTAMAALDGVKAELLSLIQTLTAK